VGVGETDPNVRLHSSINTATEYDDTYNLSNSNNLPIYALRLDNNDTSITNTEVNLLFSAGASGSAQHSIGVKRTGTNDGDLIFRRRTNTTSAESMRITDGGVLLIGRTDTGVSVSTSGVEVNDSGYISASRSLSNDSGAIAYFNRLNSTAGDLIQLRIDGIERGVIGLTGTDNMYMASSDGLGLKFNADASRIDMCNASGASLDGNADLGGTTSRIRRLYLSDGIYIGGTGSANKLDDYEEGEWLPQVEFATVGSTATTSTNTYTTGGYTKIGKVVTVEFNISQINWGNGTGNVRLTGLPFTPSGVPQYTGKSVASSGHLVSATTGSGYIDILKIYGVTTYNLMASTGSGSWVNITNSNRATINPNSINGSFTYYTNS